MKKLKKDKAILGLSLLMALSFVSFSSIKDYVRIERIYSADKNTAGISTVPNTAACMDEKQQKQGCADFK